MTQQGQPAARGIEHALDLSREGVTLFRRTGGAPWAEISHAPLQLGTLGKNLPRLADIVRRGETGAANVEVWLPFDQVDMRVIGGDADAPSPESMRKIFAQDGIDTSRLAFDADVGTGAEGRVVAAIPTSVLEETRDFLEPHGFQITAYTTRARQDELALSPMFFLGQKSAPRSVSADGREPLVAGAIIAAVAVLALGLRLWPVSDAVLTPITEVRQVALAPDMAPVLDHPLNGATRSPSLLSITPTLGVVTEYATGITDQPNPQLALALVDTPLPPAPGAKLPPALDANADYRDSIPWGFVPAIDIVGMEEDQPIFTAPLLASIALLGSGPTGGSAPNIQVASLQAYVGNGIPAGALAPANDTTPNSSFAFDTQIIRPEAAFDRADASSELANLTPEAFDAVLPGLVPGIGAKQAGDIARPTDADTPAQSLELASLLPTRRITQSGVLIQNYAPDDIPPTRPFFEPAETTPVPAPRTPILEAAVRTEYIEPKAVSREATTEAGPLTAEIPETENVPVVEPEVTVIAALPDITPPRRPASEPDEPQDVAPVANPDIAALILRSQEDALAPSQLALSRQARPSPRPSAMVRDERDRLERLAALAPSANAITQAARPSPRPAALARAVATAVPRNAPEPEPSRAVQPRVVNRPAPDLPTSASVARAATINNALPMRRLSLIGVFGKSGSRTALVRLPNGRYVRVSSGDRVDGYEVSAIDRNSMKIRRRGRETVLVIPQ